MPTRRTVSLLTKARPERSRSARQAQSPSRHSAGYPRVDSSRNGMRLWSNEENNEPLSRSTRSTHLQLELRTTKPIGRGSGSKGIGPCPERTSHRVMAPGGGRQGRIGGVLSRNLEKSLHRALACANERRHESATLEHLLLALTEDQDAIAVLRACGVELDRLRREV